MTTTVRLPHRVEQALASYCVETRRTKSEVIVELLEQRFMSTGDEHSPYELAREAGFIGSISGSASVRGKGDTKASKTEASKTEAPTTKARVQAAIRKKHSR